MISCVIIAAYTSLEMSHYAEIYRYFCGVIVTLLCYIYTPRDNKNDAKSILVQYVDLTTHAHARKHILMITKYLYHWEQT